MQCRASLEPAQLSSVPIAPFDIELAKDAAPSWLASDFPMVECRTVGPFAFRQSRTLQFHFYIPLFLLYSLTPYPTHSFIFQ
jgi:hypothetical protein